MKALATSSPEIVDVTRVDHLPLVGAMLRELAVKDMLDALIPPHKRHVVTVGECLEALVLTILTGEHALSRVADTLAGYDLASVFQRQVDAAHFHDNRLGRALDALWTAGLDRLYGAVMSHAIQPYALDLARLHTDTTSLKVYGAYERGADEEGPLVTFGYSRDHRPDLKQLLFGLTVTADGVPVWGHVTDGNRSDSSEHRFQITPLRQYLPDVGAPLLIADSKFFAGETIALAAEHRFRFVTLVPQAAGLRQEVVDSPALRALPLLWEQPGRSKGQIERYHGASVVRPYRWKTAAGEVQEVSLRFLVVESSQLAKAKAPRVAAAQRAEQAQLATLHQHVLATNVLATQDLSDADLLRAYKGQPAVELSCKWAKNPAAIAPIFLETPTRIAALGCVYLIALLVYTLVERQVRKALAERGETLPDRPAPSQRPTARTVFHLMRHLAVVTVQWARRSQRQVTRLNGHQLHVLRLLGYEPSIYTRPRRN